MIDVGLARPLKLKLRAAGYAAVVVVGEQGTSFQLFCRRLEELRRCATRNRWR
jgi:hypothetical protein